MNKRFVLVFSICFLMFTALSFSQNDIKPLIEKRDSSYSVYQRNRIRIEPDSSSSKLSKQLKSMDDIIERDNLIIDLVNEKLDEFTGDTSIINKKERELAQLTTDLDNKNNAFAMFLVISVVMGGLMVLFVILYLNANVNKRKLAQKAKEAEDIAQRYLAERSSLLQNENEKDSSFNAEYITLKEVTDKELMKQKEIQLALKKEIQKLNDEFLQAENVAHNAKEENANLQNEIDELREMLKQLSNVPREKIEEMELNFLKVEKLNDLLAKGTITSFEFEEMRKNILNEIQNS